MQQSKNKALQKIKTIEIQAAAFFEMLKKNDQSMWSIFAQMIDENQEQLILFFNEKQEEIAHYILPKSLEQLQQDQHIFAASFKEKLGI